MNLGEIRTRVWDFLQEDPVENHVLAVEVDEYIHQGHMELFQMVAAKQENFFVHTELLSEVSGQENVPLPTNLFRTLTIERIAGGQASETNPIPMVRGKLDARQINDPYARFYNTQPQDATDCYVQLGQANLMLIPPPQADRTSSIRLRYVFRPARMTSDRNAPLQRLAGPEASGVDTLPDFHDYIFWYALECACAKEESPQAGWVQQKRLERKQSLERYLKDMNSAEPRFIGGDDGDYDFEEQF